MFSLKYENAMIVIHVDDGKGTGEKIPFYDYRASKSIGFHGRG